MTTLSRTAQVRLIVALYNSLPDMHYGWSERKQDLMESHLAGERQHRRGQPQPKGFSATAAAQYFTVRDLWHLMNGATKPPKAEEFFNVKTECFMAAAIVHRFGGPLTTWIQRNQDKLHLFDTIDYAKLMS